MKKTYLLDTNIVSEFVKERPNEQVIDFYNARKDLCAISSITWQEIIRGVSRMPEGKRKNTLKSFGNRPVCDVYVDSVEYSGDFDSHIPIKVHTIVLFYLKGANNQTYLKGCGLHDLLMQEFITNTMFKHLTDVVRDTYITNSEIRNQTIRGGYGVMGAFELTHDLY